MSTPAALPPAPDPTLPAQATPAVSEPAFWEQRYRARDTRWDLDAPAPPLVDWFSRPDAPAPPAQVLVPGCGRGHDALWLAARGFDVLAADFAEPALDALRRRRRAAWIDPKRCRAAKLDVLRLPARLRGAFDVVVEHTCYCAIDPARRDEYVANVAAVLRPGGLLVALLFPFRADAPGPPFPVTEDEIARRFSPCFEVGALEAPASSHERHRGAERLAVMRRR